MVKPTEATHDVKEFLPTAFSGFDTISDLRQRDTSMDDNGILLAEWKEIRESLRYFGNKRFAQLTVFLAAEGATINAFLSPSEDLSRLVFQSAGLLLAVLFFVMELSSVTYWKDFAARGEEIETTLKLLKLMTKHRQSSGTDSATKATYFLYVSVAL
ncbi:MAG: hypothetical protein IID42_10735, partial [Planctomycetes bacterium]|nr:hypothetical protein [Planctomycetota bacterium]